MSKPFKPLLAAPIDFEREIEYPMYASRKLDGIRCLLTPDGPRTRKLEPIPNYSVNAILSKMPVGLDGELMMFGEDKFPLEFNQIQSAIMSEDGTPDFRFMVFDCFNRPDEGYENRLADLVYIFETVPGISKYCGLLPQVLVDSEEEILELLDQYINIERLEGVMLRKRDGIYKYGRSTAKQQILLKVKQTEDDEAKILFMEEEMTNMNELTVDNLGYAKRSSKKEGKVPTGIMGALQCYWRGVEFSIGTGFTKAQRKEMWENQHKYLGKMASFRYQGVGPNGRPRFPRFKGMRYD